MEHLTDAMRLFRTTREWVSPILAETAFTERGVLTPEEFVRAGDHLVSCCPSWTWCEGDEDKVRGYLPKRKQFLLTRGVPCLRRVSAFTSATINESTIQIEGGTDWEAPSLTNINAAEPFSAGATHSHGTALHNDIKGAAASAEVSADDEYLDMEDNDLALDEATVGANNCNQSCNQSSSSSIAGQSSQVRQLVPSRRYDMSITYDKYYQTPRIFLFGCNQNGSPLSTEEVYEDVMQDYAKKTVTIEPHPHLLNRMHASVHPCQHGAVMKNMIENLVESGQTPNIDQYIFIFLKFIQSVVPTIEYDYTFDVQIKSK